MIYPTIPGTPRTSRYITRVFFGDLLSLLVPGLRFPGDVTTFLMLISSSISISCHEACKLATTKWYQFVKLVRLQTWKHGL